MSTTRSRKSTASPGDAPILNATLGELLGESFTGIILTRRMENSGPKTEERLVHVKDLTGGALPPLEKLVSTWLPRTAPVERLRLRSGDILISSRGLYKVGMVREEQQGAIAGPNLLVLRPGEKLNGAILFAYLRHPETEAFLQHLFVGTTVPSLSLTTLLAVEVQVPPPEKQRRLARLVELGEVQYFAALDAAEKRRSIATELAAEELRR